MISYRRDLVMNTALEDMDLELYVKERTLKVLLDCTSVPRAPDGINSHGIGFQRSEIHYCLALLACILCQKRKHTHQKGLVTLLVLLLQYF